VGLVQSLLVHVVDRVIFHRSFAVKASVVLAIFVILSAVVSCQKSSVKLNPVKGKVLFKDQPAEGAQIVFRPAGENAPGGSQPGPSQPNPFGDVKADGTFTLRTEPIGEGAPAGEYVVMISWYTRSDPEDALTSKSKLPAKYADPANPILKATVKEGDNDLPPFDLKP
jgi:hypothetical protein